MKAAARAWAGGWCLAAMLTAQAPQTGIEPQRALEIENALVRAGYLEQASGVWDAKAIAAMRQYQLDHQWQTKFVPDARALIALGLK